MGQSRGLKIAQPENGPSSPYFQQCRGGQQSDYKRPLDLQQKMPCRKNQREPIRCLKCQGWNHLAKDCTEEKDTCSNCAGPHRTNSCLTKDIRCASCKTEDHASWNRSCPTFLRKAAEFNNRNPDNLLQYFPTADSWTWSATIKTPPPPMLPPKPRLSPVQLGKRPQTQ